MNKYTGETFIELGGKSYTIVFDWKALAAVRSLYGDEQDALLMRGDVNAVANVLACGLMRHHPEMTAEKIIDLSPPFIPTVKALDVALNAAYYGVGERSKTASGDEVEPVKKKKIISLKLFAALSLLALLLMYFGGSPLGSLEYVLKAMPN